MTTRRLSIALAAIGAFAACFALAAGSWMNVASGLMVAVVAFIMHARSGGGAGRMLGGALAAGSIVGLTLAMSWQHHLQHAPRRDLAKDATFVERGTLASVRVGDSYERPIGVNGRTHYEYCGDVSWSLDQRQVRATRCDLTPSLVRTLIPGKGEYLAIVYLPEDLSFPTRPDDTYLDHRAYLDDFRYLIELDPSAQQQIRERHPQPE